jgi:flavin-dependent dehydrogenase
MREIRIAGGGLAGLTLGILLREKGIPASIWEAGSYPRHRVCGEFISGNGAELCQEIFSTSHSPERPDFRSAHTVRFFLNDRATRLFRLPRPALSVSRFELDQALASRFESAGGRLHQKSRWLESFEAEGSVRATGRRLYKSRNPKLIGLKVHARNLQLSTDLELHFAPGAYVGLSRLPYGQVNICGLFRLVDQHPTAATCRSFIASHFGSRMQSQFERCELDENSFCAVAGISLAPERATASRECRIGDSICMIAPLTGNGMSLAFESASCASEILGRYSKGCIPWDEARCRISHICDNRFGKRLRYASFLQKCVFTPPGQWLLLSLLKTIPSLFGSLFHVTRG